MPRVFVDGVRKWNCVSCGWIVADNTVKVCPACEGDVRIIPLVLDNTLALVVNDAISAFYKLECVLSDNEDALLLVDEHDDIYAVIRTWSDFRDFFGNALCRLYGVKESE